MKEYRVGVVGALGAVGSEMIRTLEMRGFPVSLLKPLDVAENVGKTVMFQGRAWSVEEAKKGAFEDLDIALFSAGATASSILAKVAAAENCIVIDNSSQWRMDPDVPLVVPEVNPEALRQHKGLIANPNCSTIQMLVALKPIHDLYTIERIVVSTYQAVSGGGQRAIDELYREMDQCAKGEDIDYQVFPRQILFNAIPEIDVFFDNGYTKEELKMVDETHKILDPAIAVSPTAVRVPVIRCHSESINVQTKKPVDLDVLCDAYNKAPGVTLVDKPLGTGYVTAVEAEGSDNTYVSRIRVDESAPNCINMWVVADNLRKGAALNAVQIAEKMVEMALV